MTRILKKRTFSGTMDKKEQSWEKEHRMIARRAASDGMVLLKNEDHILPLKKGCKVALYGAGAGKTIKGGTGSGDVNERKTVSIYEGMKNAGYDITTQQWIKDYDRIYDEARQEWKNDIKKAAEVTGGGTMDFFEVYSTTPFRLPAGPAIDKADKDDMTDTAIYVISRIAGEGADRFAVKGDYYLKDDEHKMLEDICCCYKNVIVVINAGAQIDLSFMSEFENIKGLLVIVQPGMEGGNAFADVICGKVTPSGKLVDTWAFNYDDYPNSATFSHNNKDVNTEVYEEGIYVGYRYFDTFRIPVRYGFGFGLSYTEFELSVENVEKSANGNLRITVKVKNVGMAQGREVVQIYVSVPQGKVEKESRRLAGFKKTKNLQPGEEEMVQIEIPVERLTYYSEKMAAWILEDGDYGIWAGNSLNAAKLCACAKLDRSVILEKDRNICSLQQEIQEISQGEENAVDYDYSGLTVINLDAQDYKTKEIYYRENNEIYDENAMQFVNGLTEEELMHLATGDPGKAQGGNLGAAGISVPGSAGETHSCALDKGLASIVLADGPAGLRLMKYYHVYEGKIVQMPFEFSLEGGLFYDEKEQLPGDRYYQYCTAIPVGTLLAQTWDTELVSEVGYMIGNEMNCFGVTLWLAPGMNIHRNPLCGRNFEYYSEDPLVAGMIAAAMTNGVQKNKGCGTTIKHFACNNQEDNRMGSNSVLSERALREIYLKGFEIAVKQSHPMSIMTSYNLINGVHAANNHCLCTDVARNEWGFDGLIMTDWTTTERDDSCTAAGCMRAGNDLVMPGCLSDQENLKKELEEGTLDISDLKACIARLVSVCFKSNQYE